MIDIGTVRGYEVTENKDSDTPTRMLQVELTNAEDLQSIEMMEPPGEDSNPQPGTRVLVLDLGPAYRVTVATDDGVTPDAGVGEKKLYSYDSSGNVLAYVYFRSDGVLEVNGNSDYAVSYTKMKEAFDELKSDFNDLVTQFNSNVTVFNTHVHPGVTAGGASTSTTVTPESNGSASTASMAAAREVKVLLPGPPSS